MKYEHGRFIGEMVLMEKLQYLEEMVSQHHFVHLISHMAVLGSNPGLHIER
jgi:hypothetical protein